MHPYSSIFTLIITHHKVLIRSFTTQHFPSGQGYPGKPCFTTSDIGAYRMKQGSDMVILIKVQIRS